MSAAAAQKIPKPQLRGLLRSYTKRSITFAILSGIAASIVWKITVCDPRKKAYAEFYKTYDPDEHYRAMMKAGVLPPPPTFN